MKLFVWDFHGVLETGNENAVTEITNKVLKEFGYSKRLSKNNSDKYYGLKWYQYFEKLLPEAPHSEHINLQNRCFNLSDTRPDIVANHIKLNNSAKEVLTEIKKYHQQILISNTHPVGLTMFIESVKLADFFDNDNTYPVDAHKRSAKKSKREH